MLQPSTYAASCCSYYLVTPASSTRNIYLITLICHFGHLINLQILALMPAGIRSASFASPGTESKSPSSGCGTARDYDAPTKIPPLSISNIEVEVEGKRATISFDLISDSPDIGDGNTGIGENISSPSGRLQWEWKLLDGGWRLQL